MDKQKILETIAHALDQLEGEGEHLIGDLDVRSVSNEQICSTIHLWGGELTSFHFSTRAYIDERNRAQKRVSEMLGEPDWTNKGA